MNRAPLDLPGYGRSFKPRTPLSISGLADALSAWMDAERIERAHLDFSPPTRALRCTTCSIPTRTG
jgi:hypothetical protein